MAGVFCYSTLDRIQINQILSNHNLIMIIQHSVLSLEEERYNRALIKITAFFMNVQSLVQFRLFLGTNNPLSLSVAVAAVLW